MASQRPFLAKRPPDFYRLGKLMGRLLLGSWLLEIPSIHSKPHEVKGTAINKFSGWA